MYRTGFTDSLKKRSPLTDIIFFIGLIFFISIRFKYILFFQAQLPVFLFTKDYFNQFLIFPGGIAEYLATFLRQFYIFSWAGFFINSLVIFFASFLTKRIIKILNITKGNGILHYIPAVILYVLHSNYQYNLAFSVCFILALALFFINISISRKHKGFRLLMYLFSVIFIYFTGGGIFLFYALMCVLYEIFFSKTRSRFYISTAFLIIVAVLPYFSARYLFNVSEYDAWFYLIPINIDLQTNYAVMLLFLFFPVLFLLFLLPKLFFDSIKNWVVFKNLFKRIPAQIVDMLPLFINTIFIISTLFLAFLLSNDKAINTRLKVQYYADNNMWEHVLETAGKFQVVDKIVNFQTNRALFHTNQLGEKMFSYPQNYGFDALFVNRLDDVRLLELSSDLYFDMGFINESKHWAFEAFVYYGNKPRILQRLALIFIINKNYDAASRFLNPLSNTLFYRKWAKEYKRKCVETKLLENDDLVQEKRQFSPQFDFFEDRNNPDIILKFLLMENKKNKMAFEYLMVYYMLSNKFLAFYENLYRINDFDYDKIPRHFQEAISVVMDIRGETTIDLGNYKFDQNVMLDFRNYVSIMRRNKGDSRSAMKLLKPEYGYTYWYFLDYYSPVTQKIRMEKEKK